MKKILITGAGGTVGLTLIKAFLSNNYFIIAVDRSEEALTKLLRIKQEEENSSSLQIEFGDVLNEAFIREVVYKYNIEIIIHGAALKHVSTGYYYPEKLAFENIVAFSNILNVVRSCDEIKKVILCSSDKAVQSSSVMGASKRFLEILGENANIPHAEFVAVRFGNILHSSGSLISVIEQKIAENKPLVIRDKRMTRYVLTIRDVVDLTMFAIEKGNHGDICSIETLSARVVDIAAGFIAKKKSSIPILYGENDMGEAIHEALFSDAEIDHVTRSGRFFVYHKNRTGDLSENDKEHLTGSGHFPVDSHSLLKIL